MYIEIKPGLYRKLTNKQSMELRKERQLPMMKGIEQWINKHSKNDMIIITGSLKHHLLAL
jgi:hypothetical protein